MASRVTTPPEFEALRALTFGIRCLPLCAYLADSFIKNPRFVKHRCELADQLIRASDHLREYRGGLSPRYAAHTGRFFDMPSSRVDAEWSSAGIRSRVHHRSLAASPS